MVAQTAPRDASDCGVGPTVGRHDHHLTGDNFLPSIAVDIKAAHEAVGLNARAMAERALEAGRLLIEAKDNLRHGEFLPWLKDNVGMSERTARRYMTLAKSGVKTATVADLGIVGAIDHHANVLKVPLPNAGECVFGYDGSNRYLFIWHEPNDERAEYLLAAVVSENGADGWYRGVSRAYLHDFIARWPADEFTYGAANYERLPYAEHAEFLEGLQQSFWRDEVASWRSGGVA